MLASELEPFKEAKARAVERFERLYIERMLLLNTGNIARAAKAASKNRRAFWELLRKHHIDASRYRYWWHNNTARSIQCSSSRTLPGQS